MKIKIDQRVLTDILPGIVPLLIKAQPLVSSLASFNLGTTGAPLTVTKDGASSTTSVVDSAWLTWALCWTRLTLLKVIASWLSPPRWLALIKKSELKDAALTGDSMSIVRNGRLGMVDRFTIYVSHNLYVSSGKYNIIAGHKMGFTFASQMTNMETIRSESTFGNIIRGLQVYGYKVVKGEALSTAVVQF
jgi:hypothetical protein